VRESFRWERLHLVVAVSANKDVAGIAEALVPVADDVVVTRNDSVRSADPSDVAAAFGGDVQRASSVADAIEIVRRAAGPNDVVLVTGSLYTVADAERALAAAR
jgi:folylpolyglutamate synthase/dihydropteroate synthase